MVRVGVRPGRGTEASFGSDRSRERLLRVRVGYRRSVTPFEMCRRLDVLSTRAVEKMRLELLESLEVYRSTLLIARITAHHTHPLPHPGLSGVPLFRSFGSRPPILDSRRHVLPNNSGVIYFFCCQSSCRFIPIRGLNPSLDKLSMRNP